MQTLASPRVLRRRAIHSARLERWLGAEKIEDLVRSMKHGGGPGKQWYGPPINLRDVPGSVWITGDGDFHGAFERGFFANALDSLADHGKRLWKAAGRPIYQQEPVFGSAFASISDVIYRSVAPGPQLHYWQKATPGTATANVAYSMWGAAGQPSAGAAGSAAPGGRAPTSATAGAIGIRNPAVGTLHLIGGDAYCSRSGGHLLMYDRIFDVAKTMSSTATEAVTGVPSRYQSLLPTDDDFVGGNFLFPEVQTALGATAHNWTVIQYKDQADNTAESAASIAGNASAVVGRIDLPVGGWFIPLNSPDVGIKALTQMQCSASVTGGINFVIGHPIGFMVFPLTAFSYPFDWITNLQQQPRVFNDAALAFIEMPKWEANACTYSGMIYLQENPT